MPQFVLREEVVESCIWELARRPAHRHLPGYLTIVRTAQLEDSISGLDPDFRGFHNAFLRVRNYTEYYLSGHKSDEEIPPYLNPFGPGADPDRDSLWLNPNVAGTYAPSSVRSGVAFTDVVEVNGSRSSATYSLTEDHAERALENFCEGQKLPLGALSCFLYRDFAIEEPDTTTYINIFLNEFGYKTDEEEPEIDGFDTLYTHSDIEWDDEDAFIEVNDD